MDELLSGWIRQALEHVAEPVLVAGRDGTVRWLNTAARATFQVGRQRLELRRLFPSLAADPRPGEPWRPMRAQRLNGTPLDTEVCVDAIDDAHVGVVVRLPDQPTLDPASATGRILANISHELRTPLNAIIGYSELLGSSLTDPTGEHGTMVRNIHRSGLTLLRLVNELLDVTKVASGSLDLATEAFALDTILDDVVQELQPSVRQGVTLGWHAAQDFPPRILGDPARWRQIASNLVGNAVKFTHQGSVSCELALKTDAAGHDAVQLTVRDTGIGIAADQLERIFEPFQQADTSTTRRYGGTGLGLALIRRLVQRMGGYVWAQSTLGHGTLFTVEVPLQRPPREAATREDAAPVDGLQPGTWVVLDPVGTLSRLCTQVLAPRGIEVAHARNAAEAMEHGATGAQLLLVDDELTDAALDRLVRAFGSAPVVLAARHGTAPHPRVDRVDGPLDRTRLLRLARRYCGDTGFELQTLGGLRVLLVEDNAVNQHLGRKMLQRMGCEVVTADNGQQAMTVLEQDCAFSVVLMDMQMPVLDGFETVRLMREYPPTSELPVIAVTAHTAEADQRRSMAAGCDAYLTKPVDWREAHRTMLDLAHRRAGAPRREPARTDEPTPTAMDLALQVLPSDDGRAGSPGEVHDGASGARLPASGPTAPWSISALAAALDLPVDIYRDILLQAPAQLQSSLAQLAADASPARVRKVAHSLKGTLASLGFVEASEVAHRLEQCGRAEDRDRIPGQLAALERAVEQVVRFTVDQRDAGR